MKKFVVSLGIAALLGIGAAWATEVTILSGSSGYNHPLILPVTTNRVGDFTAEADWTPKGSTRYVLTVKHLLNSSDPFSYDVLCQVYEPLDGSGSGQTVGHYHCDFPSAPTGYWTAEFRPLSGKTSVTLTVTGETD